MSKCLSSCEATRHHIDQNIALWQSAMEWVKATYANRHVSSRVYGPTAMIDSLGADDDDDDDDDDDKAVSAETTPTTSPRKRDDEAKAITAQCSPVKVIQVVKAKRSAALSESTVLSTESAGAKSNSNIDPALAQCFDGHNPAATGASASKLLSRSVGGRSSRAGGSTSSNVGGSSISIGVSAVTVHSAPACTPRQTWADDDNSWPWLSRDAYEPLATVQSHEKSVRAVSAGSQRPPHHAIQHSHDVILDGKPSQPRQVKLSHPCPNSPAREPLERSSSEMELQTHGKPSDVDYNNPARPLERSVSEIMLMRSAPSESVLRGLQRGLQHRRKSLAHGGRPRSSAAQVYTPKRCQRANSHSCGLAEWHQTRAFKPSHWATGPPTISLYSHARVMRRRLICAMCRLSQPMPQFVPSLRSSCFVLCFGRSYPSSDQSRQFGWLKAVAGLITAKRLTTSLFLIDESVVSSITRQMHM